MESTPRPILDVDDLEPYDWPPYPWEQVLSMATKVIVSLWRRKQKRLFELYDVGDVEDSLTDPNPFEPYYVFYVNRSERFR